ncbi:MAG: ribonuclease HI family protein [Candidatus Aceula lacicola]|nr:ribonuclease HI family protein [Candidatus Aceula lacicola]
MSKKLRMFVDGACRGNPGPAGIGVAILDGDHIVKEISKPIGDATNNIAEYSALVFGLQEALKLKAESLEVFMDSELVCRQIAGQYKIKSQNLKFLYDQAMHLLEGFKDVKVKHVPREQNKQADKLATGSLKD